MNKYNIGQKVCYFCEPYVKQGEIKKIYKMDDEICYEIGGFSFSEKELYIYKVEMLEKLKKLFDSKKRLLETDYKNMILNIESFGE